MNRTFKVAKSLTRGVVVTSEKASSYQGKAVKTVIAAAVSALVAGVAMAGETTAASTEWKDKTINQDFTVSADTKLISATLETGTITLDANIDYDHTNDQGTFNMKGGKIVNSSKTLQVMDFTMTGGSIEAVGADGFVDSTSRTIPNVGSTNTFVMEAGEISLKNGGRIWIGSSWWKDPSHYNRMELKGGTINMQGQGYITGLNRYIAPGEYYGGENQPEKVVITQDTLAHNVLGLDGVNLNIAGKGNIIDFVATELTAGKLAVAEGGELTFRATTATNEPEDTKSTAEALIAQKSSIVVKGGEISNQGTIDATKIANFAVEGGMVTNAGTMSAKTVTIKSGTVDNTGSLTADTLAIQGGTVNTVAGAKYAVATTSLEKNGTLNLTALNSNQYLSFGNTAETGKTYAKDQFLVYGTLNLNGGALLANGEALQKMKVGSGSTAATVNVNSDFAIADLAFGTKGTVNVAEDATLTVNDLYLTVNKDSDNNAVTSIKNDGTVVVTGDVTTPKGLAVSDMQDAVFVNNGTVYTNIDNVVTLTTADGKISAAAITAFGSILNGDSGNVYESADRTLTLSEYNKIAMAMGKLTMLNTVVTSNTAGEDLKFSDVATNGLNSPATTVTAAATDKAVTLAPTAAVLVANVKTDAESVTIDGSSAGVTLAGNDGVLFGTGVKTVTIKGTNGLTLGYEAAEKTGSIAGEVAVESGSKLAVEAGSFTIAGIDNKGTLAIDGGDLTTSYLTGSATITDGILAVLGNKAATTATGKATPAADSVDPFANAVKVDQITFNGSATDKDTGILAVGANAQAAEVAVSSVYDAHELAGKNIVYLTKQAKFSAEPAQATDYLIDVAQVAASEGFTAEAGVLGNTLTSQTLKAIKLTNVTAAALEGEAGQKTLRVAQTGSTATAKVDFGNWFYGEKDYESTVTNGLVDGVITFSPNKDKIKQIEKLNVAALAKDAADNVTFGQNEIVDELAFKTVAYNEAVTDRADELGLTGEEHSKYIASAMETYFDQLDIASELAIAGGVFGTTLDINDQVTAALDRRTSLANLNAPRTEGFTPWVDVFGTKNEAKRIYGEGAGYEADIYGAVLGFDYTAACGGVLGLAFNVGQADGNSVGIGSAKVENDADFYGVSLYAAQTFGDFNVKADLGYTQVKNDLKMNGVTKTWKESQDADVITFGVGTEYLVKAGALNVVPHAGIRMTRIDLDDSKYGAEYETMTVYQMPLGVAFSGTFDTNGWKVAPMVDLSVVPTFGDKDAEAKYFGGVKDVVRAVDSNPIRATLGVEAQTGAWTFGVNYGLTAGSDDRLNNSLNANARYTF